jgi:PadR family transcriptional regulator PadR
MPRGPAAEEVEAEPLLAPRAYLQACLLLLLGESPRHGYDLGEALVALGLHIRDSGRVYRALRRMEQDGLVVSWWEEAVRGPARRVYRLTDDGGEQLEEWSALVCDSWRHLSGYLDRWRSLADPAERRVAAL